MPAPDDTSPRGRSTLLPEQVALLDHSQLSSEQVALLDRSVWWSTSQRALGPVLGISLGLVLAARAQAARRRLAQAFSGERPTLVQFANGRVQPFPDAAAPLITTPSRWRAARTYALYGLVGAWLGSAVSFSAATTTSTLLLARDDAVWRHVIDANEKQKIAQLREHLDLLERRVAERARGDVKEGTDEASQGDSP